VTDAQTPTAGVTQYAYDTEHNLTSITDALGRQTSFDYDPLRRVTKTTFPSTLFQSYTYDAIGNLLTRTDRKQQAISYTYDPLNRLTQKQYSDQSTVGYTYDNASRMIQVVDTTGTYGFSYDNMSRLTGTSTQYSFISGRTFTMSYGYDAASNRTSFTDAEGSTTGYVYDALNRLQTLTSSIAGSFGFGYDNLNRRTSLTRPNNVTTSYSYDNLSRLLSVLHQNSGGTIDGAAYTYDNAGNRLTKTNYLDNSLDSYSYDNIYQLTRVTEALNGNPATTTESYTFDLLGNRLSSLNVAQYTYDNSNHLNSSSDGVTYTYDNNGNTGTKADSTGTTTYSWDYENRLTSVALPGPGGTMTFRYDPFGRRIRKVSPTAGTTNYLYSGANIVEEVDASGNPLARYAQSLGIDQPLAIFRGGASSSYQADGLGSITSLGDSAGISAATYKYDLFGNLSASTGALVTPLRYTGRDWDGETGLYFYRARYYDPAIGRFASEDPMRFHASGINFYRYVLNNPSRYTDHFGLDIDLLADPCIRCRMLCEVKFRLDVIATGMEGFVLGLSSGVFSAIGGFGNPPANSTLPDQTGEIASGHWAYEAAQQCSEKRGRCLLGCGLGPCNPTTTGPPTFDSEP
jgi:RHS repeat-associated protein